MNGKTTYVSAEVEIVKFDNEDVITASVPEVRQY